MWPTWDDGAAGPPSIVGDANWGKLQLYSGWEARSNVVDLGAADVRIYTLTENKYGTGQGSATLQIRGDTVIFAQDDALPAWINYTIPITQSWRYFQVREVKS